MDRKAFLQPQEKNRTLEFLAEGPEASSSQDLGALGRGGPGPLRTGTHVCNWMWPSLLAMHCEGSLAISLPHSHLLCPQSAPSFGALGLLPVTCIGDSPRHCQLAAWGSRPGWQL